MASSTGKRISPGICFGRKVSRTIPRDSSSNDRCFQNCNRLGCSVKHIFAKGTEVNSGERLHSTKNKTSPVSLKKSKEQKNARSSLQRVTGIKNTREKPKKDLEPKTPIRSDREQDILKSEVVNASSKDASGPSDRPPSKPRKRYICCISCGSQCNSLTSSSRKTSTSSTPQPNKPSEGPDTSVERHGIRKLSFLSAPYVLPSGSTSSTSVNDRKTLSSQKRSPPLRTPLRTSNSRSKPTLKSSSGLNNSSIKVRVVSSSSISHPHSRQTGVIIGNRPACKSPANGENWWLEDSVSSAFHTSTSFGRTTRLDSTNGTAQGTGNWGDRHGHRQPNVAEIPEALFDLNGTRREMWPPLEDVMAFEASFMDWQGLHDQHRDMRLDIDDMTYEELLALGEKIGTVSTALTEEALSKCIKRSIYEPLSKIPKTDNCAVVDIKCSICQEEYVAGDEVGNLHCNHLYHVDCIHEWFQMKNWCPICKSPASPRM